MNERVVAITYSGGGRDIQTGLYRGAGTITIPAEQYSEFRQQMNARGYGQMENAFFTTIERLDTYASGKPMSPLLQNMGQREAEYDIQQTNLADIQRASGQYKVSGTAVSQIEYQQALGQAQQSASTSWQQQKVVRPTYVVAKAEDGKIIAMPVTYDVYNKFTTDVQREGLKGYQVEPITTKGGYSSIGGRISTQVAMVIPSVPVVEVKKPIPSSYESDYEFKYFKIGRGTKEAKKIGFLNEPIEKLPKVKVFSDKAPIKTGKIEIYPKAIREKIATYKPMTSIEEFNKKMFKEYVWIPPADKYGQSLAESIRATGKDKFGIAEFSVGLPVGAYEHIRNEPFVPITMLGLGAIGGFAYGGLRSGATYLATATGKMAGVGIAWQGANILGAGVLAYDFVGKKSKEFMAQSSAYDRGVWSGALGVDLISMGYGFKAGEVGYVGLQNVARTYKYPELPLTRVTTKGVASGKVKYYSEPVYKHRTIFEEGKYELPKTKYDIGKLKVGGKEYDYTKTPRSWHATTSFFGKSIEVGAGSSELPALYTSPQLSIPFLRISLNPRSYKYTLSSELGGFPTGYNIKSLGYKNFPKGVNQKEFLLKKAEKGYVYVGAGKTEVEGLMPVETILVRENIPRTSRFMTKVDAVNIPLEKYYALPSGASPIGLKTTTLGELMSSSRYSATSYSIPSSFLFAGASSRALSSSTPRVSTPSISLSSYRSSYPSVSASSYPPSRPSNMSSILSSMSRALSSAVSSASSLTARSPSISKATSSALSRASSTGTSTGRTPSRSYSYSGITQKIPDLWGKMKRAKPKLLQAPTPKPRGLFYQAGFTEKTLGISKVVTEKQLVQMAKRMYSYHWRPIPIIKKTRRMRKR